MYPATQANSASYRQWEVKWVSRLTNSSSAPEQEGNRGSAAASTFIYIFIHRLGKDNMHANKQQKR